MLNVLAILLLGINQNDQKPTSHKNFHKNIYKVLCIIVKSGNNPTVHQQMNGKQCKVLLYNEVLSNNKKE